MKNNRLLKGLGVKRLMLYMKSILYDLIPFQITRSWITYVLLILQIAK